MPRKKKDGRHINYYIDREIYERLEGYADERGQQMTTAIERILKDYLDRYDAEARSRGSVAMFCSNCNLIVHGAKCSACGSRNIRLPQPEDYCYLTEKDTIWAGMLSDIFTQNGVPFITRNTLGAGLTAKLGSAMERTKFYVPYASYAQAQSLERELFYADFSGDD